MTIVHVQLPGRIVHGGGATRALADEVRLLKCERALIVTSPSIAKGRVLGFVREALGDLAIDVFDSCPAHVPMTAVLELADRVKAIRPDVVVGVGGGSALDTAKAGAVASAVHEPFPDLHRGERPTTGCVPHGPIPRLITVPTTLTGAERTGAFSVVHDHRKLNYVDEHSRPLVVIQDAELLAFTPRQLLVRSGMNSMAHSIEALLSGAVSPFAKPLHIQALRLHSRNLPIASGSAHAAAAHDALLVASAFAAGLGAQSSTMRTGIIHALAHAVTGASGAPHGAVYGIVIPVGLRHNGVATPAALSEIAEAISGRGGDGGSAIEAFIELRSRLRLPATLREVGITATDLGRMAQLTVAHYGAGQNVRPVTSSSEALALLRQAY